MDKARGEARNRKNNHSIEGHVNKVRCGQQNILDKVCFPTFLDTETLLIVEENSWRTNKSYFYYMGKLSKRNQKFQGKTIYP